MIEASHTLNTLSERGRMVPEFNEMSIREIFIKHHRLIYEVSKNRVEVLAVIHMSRDFNKAWNDRES
jgi:plasmid stabilization system protein ParE